MPASSTCVEALDGVERRPAGRPAACLRAGRRGRPWRSRRGSARRAGRAVEGEHGLELALERDVGQAHGVGGQIGRRRAQQPDGRRDAGGAQALGVLEARLAERLRAAGQQRPRRPRGCRRCTLVTPTTCRPPSAATTRRALAEILSRSTVSVARAVMSPPCIFLIQELMTDGAASATRPRVAWSLGSVAGEDEMARAHPKAELGERSAMRRGEGRSAGDALDRETRREPPAHRAGQRGEGRGERLRRRARRAQAASGRRPRRDDRAAADEHHVGAGTARRRLARARPASAAPRRRAAPGRRRPARRRRRRGGSGARRRSTAPGSANWAPPSPSTK